MITSPHNDKLKLLRKLATRRGREREGMFAAEGEDLVRAGLDSGSPPVFLLAVPEAEVPGADIADMVEPSLLAEVSALGSGTRVIGVWQRVWSEPAGPICLFLDGVSDPGNVGAIIRTAHALTTGTVVTGPGTADPYSSKSVRASMGSVFARPPALGEVDLTPRPRVGMVAHGGRWPIPVLEGLAKSAHPGGRPPGGVVTICLGSEREGLSAETVAACDETATIPLLGGGAESLNVAATAAICCERVSSPAVPATGPEQLAAKVDGDA